MSRGVVAAQWFLIPLVLVRIQAGQPISGDDDMTDAEERAARLSKVRRIVVHGGLAHMDDIMSCAMAYAFGVPHDAPI